MAADRQRPHESQEYTKLLEWVKEASSILEIGSRYGFTLLDLAHSMSGKKIVSIDWPDHEGWNDDRAEQSLIFNVEKLKKEGFNAHLILGDSHHPDILERVSVFGSFDIIFIDGDHSYKGVKQDWEYYGPLGKQVIFHDIVKPKAHENQALEVWKFWQELKVPKEEFISENSKMGLGRVRKTTSD